MVDHLSAGMHYPRSLGEFQAWFRMDEDCLDYFEWLTHRQPAAPSNAAQAAAGARPPTEPGAPSRQPPMENRRPELRLNGYPQPQLCGVHRNAEWPRRIWPDPAIPSGFGAVGLRIMAVGHRQSRLSGWPGDPPRIEGLCGSPGRGGLAESASLVFD